MLDLPISLKFSFLFVEYRVACCGVRFRNFDFSKSMGSSRAAARDKNGQGMIFRFPWNNTNPFPTDIKI
jgi:hypothetical protein